MPKYVGQPCTSCRVLFKEDDDIVVCPECGSPYHKDCYKSEGRCINTLLHESGQSWQPEAVFPEQSAAEKVCPNCGAKNKPDSVFCSSCGVPIDSGSVNRQNPRPAPAPEFGGQGQFGNLPPFLSVKTLSADENLDGNTVGEYTKYVGSNFFYYIPKFLKFAKGGQKLSFNFCAFFFPELWFFYRKLFPAGIIALVISVLSSIPSAIQTLVEYGMIPAQNDFLGSNAYLTMSLVALVAMYSLRFAAGIFGNWLYYKKAKSEISELKQTEPDPQKRLTAIGFKGGTSVPAVAIAIVIVTFATFVMIGALIGGMS